MIYTANTLGRIHSQNKKKTLFLLVVDSEQYSDTEIFGF